MSYHEIMVEDGSLKHKRPNKRTNLMQAIQDRIGLDQYVTTTHAWMRQSQRSITLPADTLCTAKWPS